MEPKYLSFRRWWYTPCSSSEVRWARILRDLKASQKGHDRRIARYIVRWVIQVAIPQWLSLHSASRNPFSSSESLRRSAVVHKPLCTKNAERHGQIGGASKMMCGICKWVCLNMSDFPQNSLKGLILDVLQGETLPVLKWGCLNSYKRPHKWVTRVITPINGVITYNWWGAHLVV